MTADKPNSLKIHQNEDGSFSSLIVMQPRLSYGLGYNGDTTVFHSLTNSVEEIYASHVLEHFKSYGIEIQTSITKR
mgnify:CR=1 FL=1